MASSRAEIFVSTKKDEGPTRSTERVDELGDHATKTGVRLKFLASQANKASRALIGLASSSAAAAIATEKLNKNTKVLERHAFAGTKMLRKMGVVLQTMLVGGLKLATLGLGAMSVALVGIHALFVTGRFLVKSYHVALKGLAATAAGAAVAIGLVSSALREQQAAMFAYTGKNNKEFGSGLNQVRVNMRGLHMDAKLAGAGVETLNKAYSEIAKSKTGYLASSKSLLKDLGDFAAAGQPLEEGLVKAAKVVTAIQDPKKGLGAIKSAFKELGPAAEEALKEAQKQGIDTKQKFIDAMKSGQLSTLGGVTGQFDAVNNTLIGQVKKYFNLIRGQFADFGQQFLPEAKIGLERIYRIFTRTMQMTTGAVAGWEKRGGFVDAIVNAVQKISDFYVKLIREYLPKSEGMFSRLGEWWRRFKEGWNEILNDLRPFIDGARVIEKMFGNAWRPIWREISGASKEFNRSLQFNRVEFEKLGTSIGETIAEVLSVIRVFERVIQENLPFINNIFKGLKLLVQQFTRIFNFMENLPFFGGNLGSQGALSLLLAMGRGMKTARGTVLDREMLTQRMNVKAGSVSIYGTVQGAIQGAKLGSHPAFMGPTGGTSPIIGAAIGGAAKGGWLGADAQQAWNRYYPMMSTVSTLTGGPGTMPGGAAGMLGLSGSGASAAGAGLASSTLSPSQTRGAVLLNQSAASAQALPASLGGATQALHSFTAGLGSATAGLASSTAGLRTGTGGAIAPLTLPATAPTGPSSPWTAPGTMPTSVGGMWSSFKRFRNNNPSPTTAAKDFWRGTVVPGVGTKKGLNEKRNRAFSALSRAQNYKNIMATSNQMEADRKERGSKYKLDGMIGAFMLQQGLSRLSNRVGDEEIKGGLGLASSMALFSPKLAAGIAGGTFAIKSGNMGLAMGGGALAGAQFGKSFGPMGTAIGAAVGTITGAIMAPINALKAKKKEAKAMVDSYFENSFGEFAVQMSLLESGARKSGKKETTVVKSMEKQAKKYRDMANLMAKGSALGGKKSGRLSLIEEMTRFGGVGAGIGAATGTGIGLATGGIGLAPGIIIGGVAGGIAGAATGVASYGFRKGRDLLFGNSSDDKRTRKDQRAVLNDLYASGAMSKSDYDRLTKKKKRRFARDEEFDMDLVNAYFTEGQKKSAAMATAMETATTTLSSRLKVMTQMTGKSEMEMMELAQTMGVNLADSTADFNEQLIKLGITVKKTAQEIDMAIAEIMQNAAATAFDTAIKQQQAPQILDELVKNFRQDFNQRGDGANVTVEDASTIARGYAEQLTNMYGGDASAAYFALQEQIGSPQGLAFRETNPLTGKKNPLGGLGNQFFSGMTGQAMTKFLEESEKGVINTMTPQMGAVLAERGKMLKPGDMKKVTEQFKNLDFGQQQAFFNAITSGNIGSNTSDFFKQYGMNVGFDDISQQSAAFKMATDNAEKEMILLEAEREIIEGMGKFFGPESSNPEWWSKDALRELFIEAGVIKPEDTRTPRGSRIGDTVGSRLSRTLSRHQEMDSMLSGKRMITSSWRNYNLGSPSSDHVTGRAYDLVGNQLGMYKTIVEKNGGFAEFHGGSTNRHLHVVPGSGPMGDTYAPFKQPVATSAPVAPAGKGDISVTLNVNGLGIKEALPQIKAELERAMYEYQNRM